VSADPTELRVVTPVAAGASAEASSAADHVPPPRANAFGWLKTLGPWVWAVGIVAAIVLFAVAAFLLRGLLGAFNTFWSYGGIKRVLYQDLGLGDDLSSIAALAIAFLEGIVWLPVIAWPFRLVRRRFKPQQAAIAFVCWILAYGAVPLLHVAFGKDVCFNQSTGAAEKWYVQRNGKIVLFDSAGYDSFGVKKVPVTPDVCRLKAQQDRGVSAKPITDPASSIRFFDRGSGLARVWYDRAADGSLRFYDGPGFDSTTGAPLTPVTRDIVSEALAAQQQREAMAQATAASATPPAEPSSASASGNSDATPAAAVSAGAGGDGAQTSDANEPSGPTVDVNGSFFARRQLDQFIRDWNLPNQQGLARLRSYYASSVLYYGGTASIETILNEKYAFARRWPLRNYSIRPDSLRVDCISQRGCVLQGVMSWDAASPARDAHSAGASSFRYRFLDGVIVEEDGRVLSRTSS
jgi:hypothetical protein